MMKLAGGGGGERHKLGTMKLADGGGEGGAQVSLQLHGQDFPNTAVNQ